MNQQNEGSGSLTPSNVPKKRKRGRPRKEESGVQGENMPVTPGSANVLNSNQTAGTTDDCDDAMLGKVVTGVIEGTFDDGYLLNVHVVDTDTCLRGVVFLPGRVNPVTAENDVAPHVQMIKRKEIPIPFLNPKSQIHSSVPSSGQCSKQPFEPELKVPMSVDQVLPTEIHSGISDSLENQSASTMVPMADLAKIDSSISTGGMPQGISEAGHESESASIKSELEGDKTVIQDETLHELDASRQEKESIADGGATKDSEKTSEPINLVPTVKNTEKELTTGHQSVPSVHKLNELIPDEQKCSNIELDRAPVSAEPESMPSERISESVDNFVEKQASPETDILEDTKRKLAIETSSKVDTSNSNGRPSTGVANILDVGSNHALEVNHPLILFEGEAVPSESKLSSEGSDFREISDPQNCNSLGAANNVDVNQPIESLVNSVESDNPIGSDLDIVGGKDGEGSLA